MGQTVTKRILISLSDLIRTKDPLDDLKEHTSIDEKRRAVRVYVDYPVEIEFLDNDIKKSMYKCKSVNLSESGVLISLKIKSEVWENMKSKIEDSPIIYHFKMPDELSADHIEGKLRRFIEKKGKKNGKVELEFGIQNDTEGPVDKLNLLNYINGRLMDSVNRDIDHIEKIMKKRDLTAAEKKIYNTLVNEYSDRN
ncbi:MAG: PilZ domain-containing protein [bacterium]|nr:PilZ domain-containing protein [bacterium]